MNMGYRQGGKKMRNMIRPLVRAWFVTIIFMTAFFLTGRVSTVYAGDSLPGGQYFASDSSFPSGSNLELTGDVTLILDADLHMYSLDAGTHNLTIRGDGSDRHTLTLNWPGNVLTAGNLTIEGINLVIKQDKDVEGSEDAVSTGHLDISDSSVSVEINSSAHAFKAFSIMISKCSSFMIRKIKDYGIVGLYAERDIRIEDTKGLDIDMTGGLYSILGEIEIENVKGSIKTLGDAVNAADKYVQIEDSDLNLTTNTGSCIYARKGVAVKNSVLTAKVMEDHKEYSAYAVYSLGNHIEIEKSDLTLESRKLTMIAGGDSKISLYGSYVKSPAGASFIKEKVDGDNCTLLADSGKNWTTKAVIVRKKITDSLCKGAAADQTYTGSEIKPVPQVSWNGKALKSGTDFGVDSYSDNKNAGTGSIKISGKGEYTGSRTLTFKIRPAAITGVSAADQTYTGAAQKPVPVVKAGSLTVPKDGYTAVYKDNVKAGKATVTVTGKGNFTGTKSAEFTIREAPAKDPEQLDTQAETKEEQNTESETKDAEKTEPDQEEEKSSSPVGKGAAAEDADAAIKAMKKDEAPAGSKFGLLQLKSKKETAKSLTIKWKKVPYAGKYVIYGNVCGKKNKMKKLKTINSASKTSYKVKKIAGKKVKKGTYYKFLVVALDEDNLVVTASKTIHAVTPGGRNGNDKKVQTAAAKKGNKITLKKGKTFKLKAKAVAKSKKKPVKKHRGILYESSDKKIAKVSKKGVITAGNKTGSCWIYAYAQNGVFAKIKVTVK